MTRRVGIYLDDISIMWLDKQPRSYNLSEDVRIMLKEKYKLDGTDDEDEIQHNRIE